MNRFNLHEKIFICSFLLFIVGLFLFNVMKIGLYVCPIYLITDLIYQNMYGKNKHKIRQEIKDGIACYTNRFSVILAFFGTLNLIKTILS